jgi:hypothetical protein
MRASQFPPTRMRSTARRCAWAASIWMGAWVAVGCGGSQQSANPSTHAGTHVGSTEEFSQKLASLRRRDDSHMEVTEPPYDSNPKPLAPGQWWRGILKTPESEAIVTYKIVGQKGDALWIEIDDEDATGKRTRALLVRWPHREKLRDAVLLSAKLPDERGNLNELQGLSLDAMRSRLLPWLAVFERAEDHHPQEDIGVRGGTFQRCYRRDVDARVGPVRLRGTGWWHTAVPVTGVVMLKGNDPDTHLELVDFGNTGARSDLVKDP